MVEGLEAVIRCDKVIALDELHSKQETLYVCDGWYRKLAWRCKHYTPLRLVEKIGGRRTHKDLRYHSGVLAVMSDVLQLAVTSGTH